jgi:hypothetical protein
MLRKRWKASAVIIGFALALAVVPAVASANTAWVNNTTPVKAPFNSCANPGFSTIQAAINSPSTAIHVCKSTYTEQLQIERALSVVGELGVVVKLPASPQHSTTPCDVSAEQQDVVSVCGKGVESVKLSNLVIEGNWPAGTCNEALYGIFVGGKANLSLTKSSVLGAGANPINGCQGGVGIRVGKNSTGQVATATINTVTVEGYQKNGISIDGKESKATISKVTVKSAPTDQIAQNGIQISRGAVGKISEATITGNECNHATCGEDSMTKYQSTGVLFYEQAKGSSVTKSTINENDIGVYHFAATEVNQPQATITSNLMENDRYETVLLDQGYAQVSKNTLTNGKVGIQLLQYAGAEPQAFGPRGTGVEDTITGMSRYAIEGLSDNQPADQFGSFTISKSKISGNPPSATVAESVFTNNPEKLKIFLGAGNT